MGERCLLGANAGIGISLGDDCVVEAGCYVTAGSKVTLPDGSQVVKASELSGRSGLLFWRNSVTGALEARPATGEGVALNAALHANDVRLARRRTDDPSQPIRAPSHLDGQCRPTAAHRHPRLGCRYGHLFRCSTRSGRWCRSRSPS